MCFRNLSKMKTKGRAITILSILGVCAGISVGPGIMHARADETLKATTAPVGSDAELANMVIPVTGTVSQEAVRVAVSKAAPFFILQKRVINDEIEKDLLLYAFKIKKSDPMKWQFIQDNWKVLIDQLTKNITGQFSKPSAEMIAKINVAKNDAADSLHDSIVQLMKNKAISIRVSGVYNYIRGNRDSGYPGWRSIQYRVGDTSGFAARGEAPLELLAVADTKIAIPVKLTVDVDARVKISLLHLWENSPHTPSTHVNAFPSLDTEIEVKITNQSGVLIHDLVTNVQYLSLPGVKGTLTADGQVR